jgi:predicted hotdog family 3-hydroxylacyl-ACP dehydratase
VSTGWDLQALLPHRGPMLLLTRAVGMEGGEFVAEVDISPASAFYDAAAGGVPAYVGVEYMAQAVAAYNGLEGRERGLEPKAGFLLGTRDYACAVPAFAAGGRLRIHARKDIHETDGISSLACRILDAAGRELAAAQLTVYEVADLKHALRRPD